MERREKMLKNPKWVMAERERCRIKQEKYRSLGLEIPTSQKCINEWAKRNRHKKRAHLQVKRAIARGDIIKPKNCSKCGIEGVIQAHHPDYSKPLEVMFLCTKCHGIEHRKPMPV